MTGEADPQLLQIPLLNSAMMSFFLKLISTPYSGGYLALNRQYIERLPIRTIDFSDAEDVKRHKRMVGLVEQIQELHGRLAEARIERERLEIGQQIAATDRQIDQLSISKLTMNLHRSEQAQGIRYGPPQLSF